MYVKDAPVSLKGSASLLCNNLAILKPKDKETTSYAVVHKALVCLSNVTKGGGIPTLKQVSCKGEGAHSSSAVQQVDISGCYFSIRTIFACEQVLLHHSE